MFTQICDEIIIIFKNDMVRPTRSSKKGMPNQNWPIFLQNMFYSNELLRCRNFFTVNCPFVSINSVARFEFYL